MAGLGADIAAVAHRHDRAPLGIETCKYRTGTPLRGPSSREPARQNVVRSVLRPSICSKTHSSDVFQLLAQQSPRTVTQRHGDSGGRVWVIAISSGSPFGVSSRVVPSVDRILRPTALRPGREFQPRWWLQQKRVFAHDLGIGPDVLARAAFFGPAVLLATFLRAEPLCMAW